MKTREKTQPLLRLRFWLWDSHAWEKNVFLPGYVRAQSRSTLNLIWVPNVVLPLSFPGSQGCNPQEECSLMIFLFSVSSSEGVFSKLLFWKTQLNELFFPP